MTKISGPNTARLWIGAAVATVALGGGWLVYSGHDSQAAERSGPPPPQVVVSKPLQQAVDTRLGFLGQFSAVDQVELRAQVGGTLTDIHFKDGNIVQKGDLLFVIDPVPYEIRLAQATAQLESATARLDLGNRELVRAQALKSSDAGTTQNVDQRQSDRRAAQGAVDQAKAEIRDAQFDLGHCRVTAPFTGRIGTHLVSLGNLVAGSRAAASPTTLLATIVSVDPIYLNFDMSESDYLAFSREHAKQKGVLADKIEIALGDEAEFTRQGTLDFVDNVIDRASGTLHARATVANPDLLITPGEFARVRLVLGAPVASLLVPDTAVLPDQSEHMVLTVAADGTVVPKQVRTGDLRGGLRVIRSGLAPGDKVIIEGIPYATPGAKVTPQDGTITLADAHSKN
ncbi:efflux RND transporter periplasmic adaptor subunit [Acidisphaera sp. L21]|uniref:efflux RND transporter periplasmic adaptor subunit n=1 Tax=Acidisphaera sp. L21 TaxID=1641851 RepID=UPI00131E0EEB|nr:efflux RND transporter periplasmic adaptor subunit [Acidisphaera sp. L21]